MARWRQRKEARGKGNATRKKEQGQRTTDRDKVEETRKKKDPNRFLYFLGIEGAKGGSRGEYKINDPGVLGSLNLGQTSCPFQQFPLTNFGASLGLGSSGHIAIGAQSHAGTDP